MRVAIVHYWLLNMRGGERVLENICDLFPTADIYTHVYDQTKISKKISSKNVKTTFINNIPFARKLYQLYLPLMPMALEHLDLSDYDLVISSESGPAKGVIVRPDARHICYCHTPMRYIWDQYWVYYRRGGAMTKLLMPWVSHRLRIWDVTAAARVDQFVANSSFVAERIRRYYRRGAEIIHPPVDVDRFAPAKKEEVEEYYLYAGELVPYKRPDLAVNAFRKLGKKLIVVGEGPERRKLQSVSGSNIVFTGRISFDELRRYFARCRALIYPGEEDFGMIPVEVMASGRPVIAFGRGGALDTVVDGKTGILFGEQSVGALVEAVQRFERESESFSSSVIRKHAENFSAANFKAKFQKLVNDFIA